MFVQKVPKCPFLASCANICNLKEVYNIAICKTVFTQDTYSIQKLSCSKDLLFFCYTSSILYWANVDNIVCVNYSDNAFASTSVDNYSYTVWTALFVWFRNCPGYNLMQIYFYGTNFPAWKTPTPGPLPFRYRQRSVSNERKVWIPGGCRRQEWRGKQVYLF